MSTEDSLGTPYPILISRVIPNPDQPRKYFDQAALEELADAIQANGQEQPISVVRLPDQPGFFEIVDGERRWRAHNLIQNRIKKEPTILAFITVVKDRKEHFRRSFVANLMRENLTSLEEAAAFVKLKEDMTITDIAKLVGKSESYVTNYIKVNDLPNEVKDLMSLTRPKEVRLSVSAAIDIVRATNDKYMQIEIAREAIENGLSLTELRYSITERAERCGGISAIRIARSDPRSDYRMFKSFLNRTNSGLKKILDRIDFERMYLYRPDEKDSRDYDERIIANMIARVHKIGEDLERLKRKVGR